VGAASAHAAPTAAAATPHAAVAPPAAAKPQSTMGMLFCAMADSDDEDDVDA
jgi:hypothetical protein